jgi:hypothetical protein
MTETNKKVGLPDPFATNAEKKSKGYGIKVAKVIESDWFNGESGEYAKRRDWIHNKRLWIRGKQDIKKYKEHVARQEGDLTYLNLDWKPLNIAEKFCNIVSSGIRDEYYRLDIRANDKISVKIKNDKMEQHRKNMRSLPLLQDAKAKLGIDLIPKGFIPEDEEELQLYTELKDRPKIEIAEELLIDYVKRTNKWQNIEEQKNKDLVQIGIAVSRTYTDPHNGVVPVYVDPENFGHSYVERNDFSDATYFFEMNSLTLADIKRESDFTDKELREIAKNFGKKTHATTNTETCDLQDILSVKVEIMRFSYKTSKTTVWKNTLKDGKTIKLAKKDESYVAGEDGKDYKFIKDTKDTWFEGNFVLGTNFIYGYKECEHIVRDEMNKAKSPYTVRATDIYKNELHAFSDNIETPADEIQYIHLKIQHLVAELKPDLITIDLDQLAELDSDGKKGDTWKTALNLLNVKGVVFTKRTDLGDMGMKDSPGARSTPTNQGTALAALLNVWAHYYNMIRDITGINPARDGSLSQDALLGVNQMAQMASNTATEHIVRASTDFNKSQCELISSRIHGIFKSKQDGAKRLQEVYTRAVGKHIVDALEVMADRNLHDFGFTVEMIPTQEEMADFKADLTLGIQEGTVDVETKAEAVMIARTNIKMATRYLLYKRRKKIKERMEEQNNTIQMQTQSQVESSKAAAQNQIESYGMKMKMDLEYQSAMAQIEALKLQAKLQIEAPVQDKEFQQEVYLKQLEVASNFNLNKFKESSKDLRIDKQSTQQSKMINQRKMESAPPIDFENNIFGDIFNTN